jgi:hypothetical protein
LRDNRPKEIHSYDHAKIETNILAQPRLIEIDAIAAPSVVRCPHYFGQPLVGGARKRFPAAVSVNTNARRAYMARLSARSAAMLDSSK